MIWRRRKSVVNFRQQCWFGLEVVAVSIGFVILCGYLLFIPPMSDLLGTEDSAPFVLEGMIRIVSRKWPLVFMALGILLIIGILMSHRLAGPLHGLERVLTSWMKGDRKERVRFRKYDYLLPMMSQFNSFLDREELIAEKASQLLSDIESSGSDAALREKARGLKELLSSSDS